MGRSSLKIFLGLCLLVAQLACHHATDPVENLTETDAEAEFRQGGIGQQLMSSYPMVGGGLGGYGNTGGFQYMAAAGGSGNAGQGYVNMLRNLYRPPSLGLTDKVKHWVKSFMNRRQYVKPYYNPSMGELQYSPDQFGGKPVVLGGNTYKAFSVPLRQLQKYYKPYGDSAVASQFLQQSAGRPGSGSGAQGGSSMLSYSPGGSGSQGSGLYASESANGGNVFSNGGAGLFGAGSDTSGLFGGSSGGNPFSSGGVSSGLFQQADGSSSTIYGASLYNAGGNQGGSLYQGSAPGSGGSVFSLDGSSSGGFYGSDGNSGAVYGSDGSSAFYGPNSGGNVYGSSAAASSLLSGLSASSGSQGYGDLFASGASPSVTIYNPNAGDQGRNYGSNPGHKKQHQPAYGASSSALYMPSSDHRQGSDSFTSKSSSSSQEPVNSFNVDSSRNSAEPSYSVSFQPAQGKSSSSFQPVAFSTDDGGFKASSGSFLGKSS